MRIFDYDHIRGRLFRRVFSKGLFMGMEEAGTKQGDGYRVVEIDNITYSEHRLVWVYVTGLWPTDQIDHINKIRQDNRFCNLREVNNSENQKNTTLRKNNNSGIMGVHVRSDNGKWSARINNNGSRFVLGCFDNFLDACCARKSAEVRFGYHENHGKA